MEIRCSFRDSRTPDNATDGHPAQGAPADPVDVVTKARVLSPSSSSGVFLPPPVPARRTRPGLVFCTFIGRHTQLSVVPSATSG